MQIISITIYWKSERVGLRSFVISGNPDKAIEALKREAQVHVDNMNAYRSADVPKATFEIVSKDIIDSGVGDLTLPEILYSKDSEQIWPLPDKTLPF